MSEPGQESTRGPAGEPGGGPSSSPAGSGADGGFGPPPQGYGQPDFGGQAYGSQPYGSQPYGGQPYDSQPYGNQPYGSQPYDSQPYNGSGGQPQPGYGQDAYPQNPYPQNPYPQNPYGQAGYGQNPAAQNPYGTPYPAAGGGAWPPQQGGTPTLDQPWYGIGPVGAVKRAFAKYARFDGRASRSEYWWFALLTTIVALLFYVPYLTTVAAARNNGETDVPTSAVLLLVVGILVGLALVVPSIAVTVRRLHDAGFSGLLYLINLIPYAGSVVVLVLTILPSRPEGARFDRPTAGPGYGGGYPG